MKTTSTLLVVAILILAPALLLRGTAAAEPPTTDGPFLELIHPQSDDQGHYVRLPQPTRATVFGLIAPADRVSAVAVNGRKARLFRADMPPFHTSEETPSVEFRVTLEVRPETTLNVVIEADGAAATHVSLKPDTEATMARLRELASGDPNDPRAHCRLGNALKDDDQLQEAIVEFHAVLEMKSECVYTRVELARALLAMGHVDEAIKEFSLATDIDPEEAMPWLNLGLVHARYTRNTDEAARCFGRYLELEPSSSIADKIRRYLDRVSP